MNYAQTYHIGSYPYSREGATKAVAPAVGRVCQLDAKPKRCRRSPQRQTKISTCGTIADGFLKTSFLPKLATPETVQDCRTAKTEQDFYASLTRLSRHYGVALMPTLHFPYPQNIALAISDIEEKLKRSVANWQEIRLLQDDKQTYLTSEERYNTGSTLYYIPVIPLYRLLKNPKRKQSAGLLLSVCAYLHHVADVPYYTQEDSFLYWQYEMLKEWVLCDDYNEETDTLLSEMEQAQWIGNRIEQKIYNHRNLEVFEARLDRFRATDSFEHDCARVAKEAFALYQQYPNERVYRNARSNGEEDNDDTENTITMDRYISFYATAKGWLSEHILQCVNTELQEYGQIEEPVIIKRFDGSDIAGNNLDFENRLFALMEALIDILNTI